MNQLISPTAMQPRRYSAFISYRHADNKQEGRRWAEWLLSALERYVIPPDLIGQPNLRGEAIRGTLYPIYRDEDEQPANADLANGIRIALGASDYLIVLCSPRSAVSPWVRKEVREFKELGRADRILAIIIAGEPNADDPAKTREGVLRDEECFCEELRYGSIRGDGTIDWTARVEPLAADLRPSGTRAEGFVTAEAYREYLTLNTSLSPDKIASRADAYRQQLDHGLFKVIAGLLGVTLGQLVDRDAAHRTAAAEAEAAKQRGIAERERELAEDAKRATTRLQSSNRALTVAVLLVLSLAGYATVLWKKAAASAYVEAELRKGAQISEAKAKEQSKMAREAEMLALEQQKRAIEGERRAQETAVELFRVTIPMANSLSRDGNIALAEEALWKVPAELRNWEWGYLLNECNRDQTRVALPYDGRGYYSEMSPVGTSGLFWIYDDSAPEGQETSPQSAWVVHLDGSGSHIINEIKLPAPLYVAKWSTDGTRLLIATEEEWFVYANHGQRILARGKDEGISTANFVSVDGRKLVIASAEHWQLLEEEDEKFRAVKKMPSEVLWTGIAGDSQGKTWVIWSRINGLFEVYDAKQNKIGSDGLVFPSDAAFSPDGQKLAIASQEETLHIWERKSPKALKNFGTPIGTSASRGGAFKVLWQGPRILMASSINGLLLWEPAEEDSEAENITPKGHDSVSSITTGINYTVVGFTSGVIEVLNNKDFDSAAFFGGHNGSVQQLQVSEDALFSVGTDGSLAVWRLEPDVWKSDDPATKWMDKLPWDETVTVPTTERLPNPQHKAFNQAHQGSATSVYVSPTLHRTVSTGTGGAVILWEESGRQLLTLEGPAYFGERAVFGSTGLLLCASFSDRDGDWKRVWRAAPFRREELGFPELDWPTAFRSWKEKIFLKWWTTRAHR